ncbi:MAG TPA: tetratricopeptide repeat-containing protein [Eudoraea sp.]|nr:tetratricopeptide repeat-containing protein [Eudoraea sp.]
MDKFEAFIVRPFGIKEGVDFDEVEKKLIIPALKKAGAEGITTTAIVKAGNIRLDMFQLLLTSELVVADISIHNANVYYELGIRHALRAGKTFMIRSRKDEVPFDLKTDRYFAYDHQDPAASVEGLYKGIKETLNSETTDSPVYRMLPGLKTHETKEFLAVPSDFSQELELAARAENMGKLRLLSFEAGHFSWALTAWWAIAKVQFNARNFKDARESWEKINKRDPRETEPHEKLATIYQRLAEEEVLKNPGLADDLFARSEHEISLLFDKFAKLGSREVAEAYALKARNDKWRWVRAWEKEEEKNLLKTALRSGLLKSAYRSYLTGYNEDLNEFYAAINALGLLKIILDLAGREAEIWKNEYDTDALADKALADYQKEFDGLGLLLQKTMEVKEQKLRQLNRTDVWFDLTRAELALLTRNSPERVARLYANALDLGKKDASNFNLNAAKRQLLLYKKLQVMPENIEAVLLEFDKYGVSKEPVAAHVILFTGHMMDAPDREKARFPAGKEKEVKAKIKEKVEDVLAILKKEHGTAEEMPSGVIGIAGGACGGDILFHEVCTDLGIKTEVYLALPREKFIARSVRFAGNQWVDRFNALDKNPNTSMRILTESEELPAWLQSGDFNYSFWERNNLWILNAALALGGGNMTFIALWDGKKGDGPGGTQNMIKEVEERGAKSMIITP